MGNRTLTDTFVTLRHRMHMVAMRILRDEADAEDAMQDTFCRLWAANSPESSDEARFRLFAVLRNVCISRIRARKNSVPLDNAESLALTDSDTHDARRIRQLLMDSLPPMQRKIFEMATFHEMEYDSIARALGISIESVRTNMCRARKKLRGEYKKL